MLNNEWIKIEDKLPPDDKWVLVYHKQDGFLVAKRCCDDEWSTWVYSLKDGWECNEEDSDSDIKYWILIPPTPTP